MKSRSLDGDSDLPKCSEKLSPGLENPTTAARSGAEPTRRRSLESPCPKYFLGLGHGLAIAGGRLFHFEVLV